MTKAEGKAEEEKNLLKTHLSEIKRFVETVNQNDWDAVNAISRKLAAGQFVDPGERDSHTLDGVSVSDIRAAALCLSVLLNTTEDVRKLLGIDQRKRGPKGSHVLDDARIQCEEFSVVCAYVAGEITKTAAQSMLIAQFGVSDRTAGRFIESRRQAAEKHLETLAKIQVKTGQN